MNNVHNKIKNHACTECGYTAAQKGSLKKHMDAVHKMGDKKYKCDICPYASVFARNVKIHSKVHDKPELKCKLCGFGTYKKKQLQLHRAGCQKVGGKREKEHEENMQKKPLRVTRATNQKN